MAKPGIVLSEVQLADTDGNLLNLATLLGITPTTFTQTYSTTRTTVDAATTNTITDSSGGTVSTTAVAAGVGKSQLAFFTLLVDIADGDLLTNYTPGYKFKILAFDAIVEKAATTGSKLSTLNLEIDTTNVTGGVISLTSNNCTPKGAIIAGTAVSAANTGSAAQTISIEASSTTAFVEGSIWMVITIQNMDTADAIATILAEQALLKADVLARTKNINSIIDLLQSGDLGA